MEGQTMQLQVGSEMVNIKLEVPDDDTHVSDTEPESPETDEPPAKIPHKTKLANAWSVRVWSDWAKQRNAMPETQKSMHYPISEDIGAATVPELEYWMPKFIAEVQRRDSTPYPPNTLYTLATGLQRHLRDECKRSFISFFRSTNDGNSFLEFRRALEKKMKELESEGIGIDKRTFDIMTDEDEDRLWVTSVINSQTAQGLSYGVYFYNCKLFGVKGMTEHRELTADQFKFEIDRFGHRILHYQLKQVKMPKALGNKRRVQPKTISQVSEHGNPRCVVQLYYNYLKSIPSDGPFYLRPGISVHGPADRRFSAHPIGMNTLSKYLKLMCRDAGIYGDKKIVVNRSGMSVGQSVIYRPLSATRAFETPETFPGTTSSEALTAAAMKPQPLLIAPIPTVVDDERDSNNDGAEGLIKTPNCPLPVPIDCPITAPQNSNTVTVAPVTRFRGINPKALQSIASTRPKPPPINEAGPKSSCGKEKEKKAFDSQTIFISVPENIKTVVIEKNGTKVTVSL